MRNTNSGSLWALIAILVTLIFGAYGYTYLSGAAVENRIEKRLDRIEQKLDKVVDAIK